MIKFARIHLTMLLGFTSVMFAPKASAGADFTFPDQRGTNRGDSSYISYFDWQDTWGTIHMNTDADGMLDPGKPAVSGNDAASTGRMPCRAGANVCDKGRAIELRQKVNLASVIRQEYVGHGIKYDIKNSVLNCMSKVLPNSPIFNGGDSAPFIRQTCQAYGLETRGRAGYPFSLIYMPIWKQNANKDNCQQEVINNCTHDVFSCGTKIDNKGHMNPIEHVFTKKDVEALCGSPGGCKMPNKYYRYKIVPVAESTPTTTAGSTTATGLNAVLARTPTSALFGLGSVAAGAATDEWLLTVDENKKNEPGVAEWTEVVNKSAELERIRAFKMTLHNDFEGDVEGFHIVDPSDFFDLRKYVAGGAYDSGYSSIQDGNPKTPDTCPILGVGFTGFGGICDPAGKAGCNLPIYGIGATTNFTDRTGQVSTFEHYPLKWSGYVKSWKIISVDQYVENTKNRQALNGGKLYATKKDLNKNPILMLERADEFCDKRERYKGRYMPQNNPDLPCIQYKQYTEFKRSGQASLFTFVDLFQPDADIGVANHFAISKMYTHDLLDGKPVVGALRNTSFISPDDFPKLPTVTETVSNYGIRSKNALEVPYNVNQPVRSTNSEAFAYLKELGILGDEGITIGIADRAKNRDNPQAFPIQAGTKTCFRLPSTEYTDGDLAIQDKSSPHYKVSTRCACVTYEPTEGNQKELFVPTNTPQELSSFVKGARNNKVGRISIESCGARFASYRQLTEGVNLEASRAQQVQRTIASAKERNPQYDHNKALNPNKTSTWLGLTSCEQLTSRPACNETKIITAERRCLLGDGNQASCNDCKGVAEEPNEPGKPERFSLAAVGAGGFAEILASPKTGSSCYFRAACFSVNSVGCPVAGASGGHIFCLTADTKIKMADGKLKAIAKIKAGEKVLSFSANDSRGDVFESTVQSLAITKGQRVLKITLGDARKKNYLKITPEHKVVLSSGRAITANDVRVGDELLDGDGNIEVVSEMKFEREKVTVYNLVLEDEADGYIASGVRVLSYPSKQ